MSHNVASSFVLRHRRSRAADAVGLDEIDDVADDSKPDETADRNIMVEHLRNLIARLGPPDQQLMLLYLEGLDAAEIGEITGLTASNVATKIHRIKKIVARMVRAEAPDAN